MTQKYYLNFKGSIGDFIKQHRQAKKINSVDLAKKLGKGNAYVSQIEHGHNKKPDFYVLYTLFKQIGIEQDRIEDYLEHFGFLSPEREEAELQRAIDTQNISMEEAEEIQKADDEYYKKIEERDNNFVANKYLESLNQNDSREKNEAGDGNDLVNEIIKADLKNINDFIYKVSFDKDKQGIKFARNVSNALGNMKKKKEVYNFMLRFFDNDFSVLDEQALLKTINTLNEETNKKYEELKSWGWNELEIKPKITRLK